MNNEMLEKEIRKVFLKASENLTLSDSTIKLKRNLKETLTYNYRVPIRIDDFLYEVEILRKKILNKYIDNLSNYMNQMLYEIRLIDASNLQSKEILIKELLEKSFKYDASRQIEEFMEDSLRPFRRLSEQREFEYLYMDIRRLFLKYIEDVNEEIFENNKQISKETKNINYEETYQDLEKSQRAYSWELLGINYDENRKKLWIEQGQDKKILQQLKKGEYIYIIDDNTSFVSRELPKEFVMAIYKNGKAVKAVSENKERLKYVSKISEENNIVHGFVYRYQENKITIKTKDGEFVFDLNNINVEQRQQFLDLLEQLGSDVKNYFERIKIVPTYASMFK